MLPLCSPSESVSTIHNSPNNQIPNEAQLKNWKIEADAFQQIVDYVGKMSLLSPDGNTIVKRSDTKLPFSLASTVKNGVFSTSILFKDHEISSIGVGQRDRVTRAYNMDKRCEEAFKSRALENLGEYEVVINEKLVDYPELFIATKDFFYYDGPCSKRSEFEHCPKLNYSTCLEMNYSKVKKEASPTTKKVGTLVELGKCSLSAYINHYEFDTNGPLRLYTTLRVAEGLKVLHEKCKFVLMNLKAENVMITRDGHVKISSLRSCRPQENSTASSSATYCMPPEIIKRVLSGEEYMVDSSFDMWSFGLLFLKMTDYFTLSEFRKIFSCLMRNEISFEQYEKQTKDFIENLEANIYGWQDCVPLLKKCLAWDPKDRMTASEVIVELQKIIDDYKDDYTTEILREEMAKMLAWDTQSSNRFNYLVNEVDDAGYRERVNLRYFSSKV